jgi:hypothetical protein
VVEPAHSPMLQPPPVPAVALTGLPSAPESPQLATARLKPAKNRTGIVADMAPAYPQPRWKRGGTKSPPRRRKPDYGLK